MQVCTTLTSTKYHSKDHVSCIDAPIVRRAMECDKDQVLDDKRKTCAAVYMPSKRSNRKKKKLPGRKQRLLKKIKVLREELKAKTKTATTKIVSNSERSVSLLHKESPCHKNKR